MYFYKKKHLEVLKLSCDNTYKIKTQKCLFLEQMFFNLFLRGHSYGNYSSSFQHKLKFQYINKVKIIINLIWEPMLFLQPLGSIKYDRIKKSIEH
jgi:hypothetical protein